MSEKIPYFCVECGELSATTEWCDRCEKEHCAFCAWDNCYTPAGEGEE